MTVTAAALTAEAHAGIEMTGKDINQLRDTPQHPEDATRALQHPLLQLQRKSRRS
ncbi:hypothetical protein EMPG_11684 [Blastomyces silverae]|uniref:Uncharacterized protein n=1 Tax=Blastomyces silverae TaxID=2060906 RepID=A0A0H1BPC0_9EURO|nr:hypothetical protein EMPG_11684 [Blastomyces silverae]